MSNNTQRDKLKGYFKTHAIPTEQNFAELIDSVLIQQDDGVIVKDGGSSSSTTSRQTLDVRGEISAKQISVVNTPADHDPGIYLLHQGPGHAMMVIRPPVSSSEIDNSTSVIRIENNTNVPAIEVVNVNTTGPFRASNPSAHRRAPALSLETVHTPALHIEQSGSERAVTLELGQESDGIKITSKGGHNGTPLVIDTTQRRSSTLPAIEVLSADGGAAIKATNTGQGTALEITGKTRLNGALDVGAGKVVVTADGKVGIGVQSPYQALDVSGTIKATGLEITGATSLTGALTVTGKSTLNGALDVGAGKVVVTADGKVGIGVQSPSQALDVNGVICGTGLEVREEGASLKPIIISQIEISLQALESIGNIRLGPLQGATPKTHFAFLADSSAFGVNVSMYVRDEAWWIFGEFQLGANGDLASYRSYIETNNLGVNINNIYLTIVAVSKGISKSDDSLMSISVIENNGSYRRVDS